MPDQLRAVMAWLVTAAEVPITKMRRKACSTTCVTGDVLRRWRGSMREPLVTRDGVVGGRRVAALGGVWRPRVGAVRAVRGWPRAYLQDVKGDHVVRCVHNMSNW